MTAVWAAQIAALQLGGEENARDGAAIGAANGAVVGAERQEQRFPAEGAVVAGLQSLLSVYSSPCGC